MRAPPGTLTLTYTMSRLAVTVGLSALAVEASTTSQSQVMVTTSTKFAEIESKGFPGVFPVYGNLMAQTDSLQAMSSAKITKLA